MSQSTSHINVNLNKILKYYSQVTINKEVIRDLDKILDDFQNGANTRLYCKTGGTLASVGA